jgi:imidazolonepropionase-like amidohydrolase
MAFIKLRTSATSQRAVVLTALLTLLMSFPVIAQQTEKSGTLLIADRIFDGHQLITGQAILVTGDRIQAIGEPAVLEKMAERVIQLGDATILPGFIELHAHLLFAHIPADIVLRHGVTTVRDLGGPLKPISGGNGSLRILTAGPILTAPKGYPLPVFAGPDIAREIANTDDARIAVTELADQGASVIKIALEPGGEHGAPWSQHAHGHHATAQGHGHAAAPGSWPLLTLETVRAIVDEAHKRQLSVSAHIGEAVGAKLALDAGVDEWAHVPCMPVPDALLEKAAQQNVRIVSTLDTMSACPGVSENAHKLVAYGATLLYGSEIAHSDVPWGINAKELERMQAAGMEPVAVLQAATSRAGALTGVTQLGLLEPGAPADIIAIPGDVSHNMKRLEYPDFVMSGGTIIIKN